MSTTGGCNILLLLLLLNSLHLVTLDQNGREHEGNVIETINDFGFDLLKIFNQDEEMKDNNLFYSPTSLAVSLAMVFLGSRGNTADEIAKAMKWVHGFTHSIERKHIMHHFTLLVTVSEFSKFQ